MEDTATLSLLDVEVRGAPIVRCGQRARSYLLPAPFATMTALLPLLESLSRYFGYALVSCSRNRLRYGFFPKLASPPANSPRP